MAYTGELSGSSKPFFPPLGQSCTDSSWDVSSTSRTQLETKSSVSDATDFPICAFVAADLPICAFVVAGKCSHGDTCP